VEPQESVELALMLEESWRPPGEWLLSSRWDAYVHDVRSAGEDRGGCAQ